MTADTGEYDLDSADGRGLGATVMDNVIEAQTAEADIPDPISEEALIEDPEEFAYEESSSHGGCNAGFAAMALMAIIPVMLRKKSERGDK